jgi:hypothetical protein
MQNLKAIFSVSSCVETTNLMFAMQLKDLSARFHKDSITLTTLTGEKTNFIYIEIRNVKDRERKEREDKNVFSAKTDCLHQ